MRPRAELPRDHVGIRQLLQRAFPSPAESELVDALRAAGRLCVSLLLEHQGLIQAYLAFSPVSVAGADGGVGLGPVAVLPERQGQGLGSDLIRAGLEVCRQQGRGFVVVLGNPHYYGRFGFQPASQWGLHDDYNGGAAFGALELTARAIPRGAGRVAYAPEFALVSG